MIVLLASRVARKMTSVVGNGPSGAMTNTRPLWETFRYLPVTQPLWRIGILKLRKNINKKIDKRRKKLLDEACNGWPQHLLLGTAAIKADGFNPKFPSVSLSTKKGSRNKGSEKNVTQGTRDSIALLYKFNRYSKQCTNTIASLTISKSSFTWFALKCSDMSDAQDERMTINERQTHYTHSVCTEF